MGTWQDSGGGLNAITSQPQEENPHERCCGLFSVSMDLKGFIHKTEGAASGNSEENPNLVSSNAQTVSSTTRA